MTSLLLDRRLVSPVPAPWVAVFSGLLAHAVCVQAVCAGATDGSAKPAKKKKTNPWQADGGAMEEAAVVRENALQAAPNALAEPCDTTAHGQCSWAPFFVPA